MRNIGLFLAYFFFCYISVFSSEYEVFFLVDSPGINYKNFSLFLQGWAKHPNTQSMDGSIGHAWILLKSPDGVWEGGHSGEGNFHLPTYAESVLLMMRANHPNPAQALFLTRNDGYLEIGSGGHIPTDAIKTSITKEQYEEIVKLLEGDDFGQYQLANKQCVTFVQKVGSIVGIDLRAFQTLEIPQSVYVWGKRVHLWNDSQYQKISVATPEGLVKKMRQAVNEKKAIWALKEYRKYYQKQRKRTCVKRASSFSRYLKLSSVRCR
jgi:hypothetical protein